MDFAKIVRNDLKTQCDNPRIDTVLVHKFAIVDNAICLQLSAQVAIAFATGEGLKSFRHAPNCDAVAL